MAESDSKILKEGESPEVEEQKQETAAEAELAPSTGAVAKESKKADEAEPSNSSAKENVPKPPKPQDGSILQLKITLLYITPPIWRRIQVLNTDTFENLRRYVNAAMGWMSDRSHQFIAHDPAKDTNDLIVNGVLEGLVYDFEKEPDRLFKEQTTKISKYFLAEGDVVMYEFDLAESWMHHIVVEKILPPPPSKEDYPKCTGGERASPPEDCGGVDGYNHILEVYKNPEHEEYDELINEWLEDMYPGYDPEKFNHKRVFRKKWVLVQH